MSEEKEVQETFSAEYVQTLRQEAANWRKQYRVLEKEVTEIRHSGFQAEVKAEFASRGIVADPSWLKINEDQSIGDAVDSFVIEYPQLCVSAPEGAVQSPKVPNALPPKANNMNSSGPPPLGSVSSATELARSLHEIEKDPVQRKVLQEYYWQQVHQAQYSGSS